MAGASALDRTFADIFEQLEGRWVGCDWATDFGERHLDLCGVTARQASLLARATSGQESAHWQEAARWLATVEADAQAAAQAAWVARQEAAAGRLANALEHARRACELERPYHPQAVWQPLIDAIQSHAVDAS